MDALTGVNRKRSAKFSSKLADNYEKEKPGSTSTKKNEFIPELYRAQTSKKFRTEPNDPIEFNINDLPSDTEAALLLIKNICPSGIFSNRLPSIILFSQLGAIVKNRYLIDNQLTKLAKEGKILTFSTFTTSNYLIVFYEDFVKLEREGVFHRFVTEVLCPKKSDTSTLRGEYSSLPRSSENSKYFSKEILRKVWKFEEDDIRKLVNAGYLGVQEGGYYCMSLPGAGEFIKAYQRGKTAVLGAIKKAKFGEILQKDLEQRPMKKSAVLGVLYHIYDLIGSGEIDKVDTTSGPLLRIKRN